MALNEIYKDAFSLSYSLGAADPGIVSGEFVVIDGIRGVAETDAVLRDGNYWVTLRHIGVFTGTTADAVTVGDPIYLAAAATNGSALTITATGNLLVGYAIEAKAAGAGNVKVRVNN